MRFTHKKNGSEFFTFCQNFDFATKREILTSGYRADSRHSSCNTWQLFCSGDVFGKQQQQQQQQQLFFSKVFF
jgi:hypothetical protein